MWGGDRGAALARLEAVVKRPRGATYGDLNLNPMWDELRSDPRFAAIVAEASRSL